MLEYSLHVNQAISPWSWSHFSKIDKLAIQIPFNVKWPMTTSYIPLFYMVNETQAWDGDGEFGSYFLYINFCFDT